MEIQFSEPDTSDRSNVIVPDLPDVWLLNSPFHLPAIRDMSILSLIVLMLGFAHDSRVNTMVIRTGNLTDFSVTLMLVWMSDIFSLLLITSISIK